MTKQELAEAALKLKTRGPGNKTSGTLAAEISNLTVKKEPSTPSISQRESVMTDPDVLKKQILEGYSKGKTRKTLVNEIVKAGYSYNYAQNLMKEVGQELSAEVDKLKPMLVNKNISILESVIESTCDSRDFRTALSAISELNKVLHAYDEKVEVHIDNNFGFDFGIPTAEPVQSVEPEVIDPDPDPDQTEPSPAHE